MLDDVHAVYGKRIVATLSSQLTWSHFVDILPLKTDEGRLYYANEVAQRNLSVQTLCREIARKAYEQREIANTRARESADLPFNVFKDPYLLDVLGLKDNFAEADLEKAILSELELF